MIGYGARLLAAAACAAMIGASAALAEQGPAPAIPSAAPPPFPAPGFAPALPPAPPGLPPAEWWFPGAPGAVNLPPRALCIDALVREAALPAYFTARLDLTPDEEALRQRLDAAVRRGAEAGRKQCERLASAVDATPPNLPQMMAMERDLLAARLASLQEIQPAMAALYEALSPDQRQSLNPPVRSPR